MDFMTSRPDRMKIARLPLLIGLTFYSLPALSQDDMTEVDMTPPGEEQVVPVADDPAADDEVVILDGTRSSACDVVLVVG